MKNFLFPLFLVVLGLFSASCQTTNPELLARDGRLLQELEPLNKRIGLGQTLIQNTERFRGRLWTEEKLGFYFNPLDVKIELENVLNQQRTGKKIARFRDAHDFKEATAGNFDLLVRPTIKSFHIRHGGARRVLLSGFLWLSTWIGGLFVEDYEYLVEMKVDFQIFRVHDRKLLDTFQAQTERFTVSFWDRNPVESVGFFESWILPPFWTEDHLETTSLSLSRLATQSVGLQLAGYLKQDFSETSLLGYHQE